jgi:hypothetical protein
MEPLSPDNRVRPTPTHSWLESLIDQVAIKLVFRLDRIEIQDVAKADTEPTKAFAEWLDATEAAQLAGMSERTLRRYATSEENGEAGKIRRTKRQVPGRRPKALLQSR